MLSKNLNALQAEHSIEPDVATGSWELCLSQKKKKGHKDRLNEIWTRDCICLVAVTVKLSHVANQQFASFL